MLCENYTSATDPAVRKAVEAQILTEVEEGRYIVVDSKPPIVSALGAIKKDTGKVRLIHDASRPHGEALNDLSPLEIKQRFQSVSDAADLLTPNCFLAKLDLQSAYRSVMIHPSNHPATGLHWKFPGHPNPTYMYDSRLPFGSRRSPGIFHRLTQAVRRMMKRRGFSALVVYLDDFLIVAPTYEECLAALNTLISLLRSLGFSIAWHKVEGPSQALTFLGILLDSRSMSLELPAPKLRDLHALLSAFAARKRASLRQFQQLAGKLNWACQVVRGGRSFLRRILDLLARLKHHSHKVLLDAEFQKDISWWLSFLSVFNGKSCIPEDPPSFHVLSDACTTGAGYACAHDWGYTNFACDLPTIANAHINVKEVLAVVLAAYRWAPAWHNSKVLIHTDNTVTKYAINKGSSRNPLIMELLRHLFWLSACFNFTIEAIHVPGRFHHLPDAISRLHEPGQSLRLQSLLLEHCSFFDCPHWFMPTHMSLPSFTFLYRSGAFRS